MKDVSMKINRMKHISSILRVRIRVTETIRRDKASKPAENSITYNCQGGHAYISLDINQKTKKEEYLNYNAREK